MNEFITPVQEIFEDVRKFYSDHEQLAAGTWKQARPILLRDSAELICKHDGDMFCRELVDVICRELHRSVDWNTRMRNAR